LNLFLHSLSYEKIILGDFNINLLCNLENFDLNSHKLFLACKEFNLWQLMCGPTHQNGSLIDHVYVSDRNNYPYSAHFPFGGSDHDLCIISRKVNSIKSLPRYISVRNLKSADLASFQNSLLQYEFQPDLNQDSANAEFWKLNNFVLNELDKVAPIRRKRVKGLVNPWFTNDVRGMCHDRDTAKKIALRTQSVNDWKDYRRKRNAASNFISKAKKRYFLSKFHEKVDSQSLWDTVNELTGFRKKPSAPISVLEYNDTIIGDKLRIHDLLAEEFTVVPSTQSDYSSISNTIDSYSESFVYTDNNLDLKTLTVSPPEIESMISGIKNSRGGDQLHVPMNIIKTCKNSFSVLLSSFFTNILLSFAIPLSFKSATVMPLYKGKGSKKLASNYRPIVLLSAFCKIFERYLFYRVYERVSSQLIPEQHAYRKKKSCHSAASVFTQYVYNNLDKKKNKVGAIFVDLKKAFDTISHEKLMLKLINNFKLEPSLVKILCNNITNRQFKFFDGSKYYPTYAGIGQGSSLGPLLFSLFVNDISSAINVPFILYADDLILFTDGTDCNLILSQLESCFSNVCIWCENNEMKVNFDKTKFMIFHKEKDSTVGNVRECVVLGRTIERVFEFRYLGLLLDPHLNFNKHFEYVISKVSSRIKYIMGVKRHLSTKAMCNMINAYVHSITDYCIDIWTVQTDVRLDKIQAVIDRFLLNFFFPSFAKKSHKQSYQSVRRSINIIELRNKCNFLSLKERSDYVLLKNLLKSHLWSPLSFTAFYERSLEYRGRKLWNDLPKDWVLNDMSYPGFCVKINKWIVSKRNNEFIYY
jgi:hypothetical protein